MKNNSISRQVILPFLSLFTSAGTLLCCALPALLVTIGMGASLAGLISIAPWVTIISQYKIIVFIVSGVLILAAFIMQLRSRSLPCPADKNKANICNRLRKVSWLLLIISITTYLIGFFFAFIAVYIFY